MNFEDKIKKAVTGIAAATIKTNKESDKPKMPNKNEQHASSDYLHELINRSREIQAIRNIEDEQPANPEEGDYWFNRETNTQMIWSANEWITVVLQRVTPASIRNFTISIEDDVLHTDDVIIEEQQSIKDLKIANMQKKNIQYMSKINSIKFRLLSQVEKMKIINNAKRYAKKGLSFELFCSKCKHTGWIESRSDYRSKKGKIYKYPCPNCNPSGLN